MKLTDLEANMLQKEIDHILDSRANSIQILDMIDNFLDKREDKFKLGSCDLIIKLRVTGHGKERINISSDECDVFTMREYKENGDITDEVKQWWKEQLNHIVKYVDTL